MIGAILARKSTLQEDRSEEARSVPRQIEGGGEPTANAPDVSFRISMSLQTRG
jgi:hypothetical protein